MLLAKAAHQACWLGEGSCQSSLVHAAVALLCTTCLLLASFDTDSRRQFTSSSAVPSNEMQITAIIQALNAKLRQPTLLDKSTLT